MTEKKKVSQELGREAGFVSKSLTKKVVMQCELKALKKRKKNNLWKIKENQPPGFDIRHGRKCLQGEIHYITFTGACKQRM